ncbi:hypothetical protein U1Q18_024103 [Sarracenia purpurea var. burkii]
MADPHEHRHRNRRRTVSPLSSPSAVFKARSTSPQPRSNQIAPCRRRPAASSAASPPSSISEFEARSEFDFWFSLCLTSDLRQSPRCSSSRCRFRKVSIGLDIDLSSSVLFG